jgi:hypothetical protein
MDERLNGQYFVVGMVHPQTSEIQIAFRSLPLSRPERNIFPGTERDFPPLQIPSRTLFAAPAIDRASRLRSLHQADIAIQI